jgi:two-component system response regulator (stage 0 sporulation protein F)
MDGIEVLRRVRETDPSLGVIMVTAVMEEELAKEAMDLGAFDYITKPIDLDYLRTSVVIKIINMLGSDTIAENRGAGGHF